MGDWLFEQPLKANGSNVLMDVPDGAYSIHTYQNVMMTPIVTDTDITEKLLFVSKEYPTRKPTITDFHFGDHGEIVVLKVLASLD